MLKHSQFSWTNTWSSSLFLSFCFFSSFFSSSSLSCSSSRLHLLQFLFSLFFFFQSYYINCYCLYPDGIVKYCQCCPFLRHTTRPRFLCRSTCGGVYCWLGFRWSPAAGWSLQECRCRCYSNAQQEVWSLRHRSFYESLEKPGILCWCCLLFFLKPSINLACSFVI